MSTQPSSSVSISVSSGNYQNGKKYRREVQRNRLNYCQLFGVQNEVNFLLLEIEMRKLNVLKQVIAQQMPIVECNKFIESHNLSKIQLSIL